MPKLVGDGSGAGSVKFGGLIGVVLVCGAGEEHAGSRGLFARFLVRGRRFHESVRAAAVIAEQRDARSVVDLNRNNIVAVAGLVAVEPVRRRSDHAGRDAVFAVAGHRTARRFHGIIDGNYRRKRRSILDEHGIEFAEVGSDRVRGVFAFPVFDVLSALSVAVGDHSGSFCPSALVLVKYR